LDSAIRNQVEQILTELRRAIDAGDVYLVDRRRNHETLLALGYTKANVLQVLRAMRSRDYRAGPEPDDKGRPGEIWKFEVKIETYRIYIKLCFVRDEAHRVVCISFHQ